ncbi:hypothetical protein [Streptomyces sp. CRN 30]|nr:hypothetical protein [Streptomyces sp. CRN 30]
MILTLLGTAAALAAVALFHPSPRIRYNAGLLAAGYGLALMVMWDQW